VGKKLYVGNLSYRVTSSDLEQLFSQYGTVESAEVISDRDTGRSKGFGFVEMSTDNEARAAIDALHDQENDGRRLTVNEARPREPRPGGGGAGGGWRGGPGAGGGYRDGGGGSRDGGGGSRGRGGSDSRDRY
jgi:RNA recognition motif-containing protein